MKKLITPFLLILFLISCQQTEFEFSCDPVINEFVSVNLEELASISINEFSEYDIHVQKAIYNSWDYSKKREAWIDKFEYILNDLDLSDTEKAHIESLKAHLVPDYFQIIDQEKFDEDRKEFVTEWIDFSVNELKWSEKFIAFVVYRLYLEESQLDAELSLLSSLKIEATANSEAGTCHCNTTDDYCGTDLCNSGECTITSGCGWLWSMPCNGTCY